MSEPPFASTCANLMCVYGDQGCGKSSLLATAPLTWKIHILDADGGTEPMLDKWKERGGDPAQIEISGGFTKFSDLHAVLAHLPPGKDLYVIDTYTTCMKLFKSKVQPIIQITDWMNVGGKISGLAVDYFDLWMRQVAAQGAWGLVLCQDKTKEVAKGSEEMKLCPDLIGAAGRDVAGMVSFLLHYERSKVVEKVDGKNKLTWNRVLRTQENAFTMAKDRSNALAAPFEQPDLTLIFDKVAKKRGLL